MQFKNSRQFSLDSLRHQYRDVDSAIPLSYSAFKKSFDYCYPDNGFEIILRRYLVSGVFKCGVVECVIGFLNDPAAFRICLNKLSVNSPWDSFNDMPLHVRVNITVELCSLIYETVSIGSDISIRRALDDIIDASVRPIFASDLKNSVLYFHKTRMQTRALDADHIFMSSHHLRFSETDTGNIDLFEISYQRWGNDIDGGLLRGGDMTRRYYKILRSVSARVVRLERELAPHGVKLCCSAFREYHRAMSENIEVRQEKTDFIELNAVDNWRLLTKLADAR